MRCFHLPCGWNAFSLIARSCDCMPQILGVLHDNAKAPHALHSSS